LEVVIERMKHMQSGTMSLCQSDGHINGVQTGRRKFQSDKDLSEHAIFPTLNSNGQRCIAYPSMRRDEGAASLMSN
ncbi:MAG: hypothetical protein WAU34_05670, partial [Desulfobacterales bacterium]